MPAALYEVGLTVVVALTLAPQAVADVQRVRAARRLRGRPTHGVAAIRSTGLPVLEDALERSVQLAASMDARGYGRRAPPVAGRPPHDGRLHPVRAARRDARGPTACSTPALRPGSGCRSSLGGLLAAVVGLWLGGRRAVRTRYRPDPWRSPEWLTSASGGIAGGRMLVVVSIRNPLALQGLSGALAWPTLPAAAGARHRRRPAARLDHPAPHPAVRRRPVTDRHSAAHLGCGQEVPA